MKIIKTSSALTLIIFLFLLSGFCGKAHANVYIIATKTSKSKLKQSVRLKPKIPFLLKQKVSIVGNMDMQTALNLIARSVQGVSLVITNPIRNGNINDFYIKRQPLYRVLKTVVVTNGYGYSYKTGILKVFGFEKRTFRIPVSDLFLQFSGSVGAAGMNAGNNNNNMNSAMSGVGTQTPTTAGATQSIGNTNNLSNPGGEISLSASNKKSLYQYLKDNLKIILKHGSFTIEPKNGIVYLSGRAAEVESSLNFLKKVKANLSHMVLLKVEVIDITLNKQFQAGINWNAVFNSAFKSNALGVGSVSIGLPLASGNDISNIPELTFGSGSQGAVINALSTQGTVDVISQPRLMLISGETRVISSGTISNFLQTVMTTSLGGLTSTTQTYPVIGQAYSGLGIAFTPYVDYKKGLVHVTINFMDNDITGYNQFTVSGNTFSEPEISAKSFTDTVIIPNNKTMVIGGILSTNKTKSTYGVPVLENIPLLGNIFKSVNYQKTKDDLIIMITPIITSE
jgi:MSHA biogenesis protein MshL